jgi:hypothetical protein
MKPIASQLAALIVTLLNSLWSKAQTKISNVDTAIREWADATFVKKSTLKGDVEGIGDLRWRKLTDKLDADTVNGQTATQIKSDSYNQANTLVKQMAEALRGRAQDFALVQFTDGASLSFPTLLAAQLGTPDNLDNGVYELRFVSGGSATADLTDMPDPDVLTKTKVQSITNGDTIQFTVANGVVTKLAFYNDTDAATFAEHGDRIADLEADMSGVKTSVTNVTNQVNFNETKLNELILAAITVDDFAGMKAYIEANVQF